MEALAAADCVGLQSLIKENKLLKHNVDKLERENHDLKRSVYELTLKCVRSRSSLSLALVFLAHLCVRYLQTGLRGALGCVGALPAQRASGGQGQ